ncbi:MAG: TetR family transcriptional regulator, partial [Candidatus Dormibacteraeota bacterium]|nr:TetR family transcriptional regulator [Candidatus Dormibacteraeota bacterium]
MSIPYESLGRTRQKIRTRSALIAVARDLVAQGVTPTVEEAAAAAEISRTTAYRYFPNQRALLLAAHPEIQASSLLPPDAPQDPAARLELVLKAYTRLVADTEPQLRTMLRLSLEPGASDHALGLLRRGRAIGWIEDALSPLAGQITPQQLRRLVLAIRSVAGIEARVWLTDVAGLSSDDAMDLMRWSARAMYRSALAEATGQRKPRGGRTDSQHRQRTG